MRLNRVLAALVLAATPLSLATAHASPAPAPLQRVLPADDQGAEAFEQIILNELNRLRSQHGLQPMARYVELDVVAEDWSKSMAAEGAIGHRPQFADKYPDGWTQAAENVAARTGGGDIGAKIFSQWANSPGHLANMLNPELNSVGIGLAFDSATGAWYATQNFASYPEQAGLTPAKSASRPANPPATEAPVNRDQAPQAQRVVRPKSPKKRATESASPAQPTAQPEDTAVEAPQLDAATPEPQPEAVAPAPQPPTPAAPATEEQRNQSVAMAQPQQPAPAQPAQPVKGESAGMAGSWLAIASIASATAGVVAVTLATVYLRRQRTVAAPRRGF